MLFVAVATERNLIKINLSQPNVVAVAHSERSLNLAAELKPAEVDLIEVRLDAFPGSGRDLYDKIARLRHPLILTARHPLEGGWNNLPLTARRERLEEFLPLAAAVDVELRSAEKMGDILHRARAVGLTVILSHHDFSRTPSPSRLQELAKKALLHHADVFKLAAHAETASDLAGLLSFFALQKRLKLSVMAMGEFGRVSRLLFARAGSVLNYGFLDAASVPGQWPAPLLKQRIQELCS